MPPPAIVILGPPPPQVGSAVGLATPPPTAIAVLAGELPQVGLALSPFIPHGGSSTSDPNLAHARLFGDLLFGDLTFDSLVDPDIGIGLAVAVVVGG